jgi:hypothetical protein
VDKVREKAKELNTCAADVHALNSQEQPESAIGEARSGAKRERVVASRANGKNRIMIYGPKDDGTYVVEFRTAAGDALAGPIPRGRGGYPELSGAHALRAVCAAAFPACKEVLSLRR